MNSIKSQATAHKFQAEKKGENPMRRIFVEKVVLSVGGTEDNLKKGAKLLEYLTQRKSQIIASRKRIPDFEVSPGLEVGARVTLRSNEAIKILRQLLGAIDNTIEKQQIKPNHFSFGIHEYIEIPGAEYKREIGIRGLNVSVVFARAGKRVARKKIKSGKYPKKQEVQEDEIIKFMEKEFKTKIK